MGLAIKGKKVIGLALNGKKLLGEAKNGKVIWRFFVASKLWESDQSGTLQNIQMDDKGLVYVIDGANINRIGKTDGSVYATKNDTSGYIGDLTFNPASSQGYVNYVSKTAYWNALNYSNIQTVYDGQNSNTSVSDVIQSNYKLNSYKVTLVAYTNGYIDVIDNSSTVNGYPIDHSYQLSSSTNYLFALDNMGTNSTFIAGDFIAYGSSNVNAFRANSTSSVLTLSGDSDIFKSNGKVTISPIGTDGTEDFYLLQTSADNKLFSVSENSSTVNVKHLTQFSPLSTNNQVTSLAIDYDNYGKSITSNAISLDGTGSASSKADLPGRFVSYDSEMDNSGQQHVYALNYNSSGNSDWTNASHEKLIDIEKDWSVSKMIKKGDNLYIGENNDTYPTINNSSNFTPIISDSNGLIYVGDSSSVVSCYSKQGALLWNYTASSPINSLALQNGTLYIGVQHGAVIRIDASDGKFLSSVTVDNNYYVYAVNTDVNGSVYVGLSGVGTNSKNVFKYNSDLSSLIWSAEVAKGANWISVDGNENVYIADDNGYVDSLDSNGGLRWAKSVSSAANGIATDDSNNVYVASNSGVFKFDSNGNQLWEENVSNLANYPNNISLQNNTQAGTVNLFVICGDISSQTKSMFKLNSSTGAVINHVDAPSGYFPGTCVWVQNDRVYSTFGSHVLVYDFNLVTGNRYKVENYQIAEMKYTGLFENFDLTTSDNGGSPFYPNSVAVSASNYAVASPANSTNKGNLLKSMCIDGSTYVTQVNAGGTQQVRSIPYENSGLFVLENSRLSYRNYASLGTVNQYLSNSGISGSDPMGVTSFLGISYVGASLGSTGTLFWQTSNGTNGTEPSMGLTDNKGSFVNNNPIKGDSWYYFISPTNKIIMRFFGDGSNITKKNFVDSSDTTSDTIAIAKNSNFMYGTKNVAGTKIYVTTPLTSDNFKLIRTIVLDSDYYLLDLASDGLGNFVELTYSSTSQKAKIFFDDPTGKFIASYIFNATYSSLPEGHLTVDPQNNNIGVVVGDSYQLWSFGNA